MIYRIFDLLLSSNIQLPELETAPATAANLAFTLFEFGAAPAVEEGGWRHHWLDERGNPSASYARVPGGYLLAVPGVADFVFRPESRCIEGYPHAGGTEMAAFRHILLDRVIPMCLGHEGKQILHASAVEVEPGQAVAFVGDTGSGKSTLAASFVAAGKPLVSDDCLMIMPYRERYRVLPNYPGMRLNDDTAEYLFQKTGRPGSVASYSEKKRLAPEGAARRVIAMPELKAIFLLAPAEDGVGVEPVSLARDFMPLVKQHFFLDVRDPRQVALQFQNIRRLVTGGIPVMQLSYPRRFDCLARARREALRSLEDDTPGAGH